MRTGWWTTLRPSSGRPRLGRERWLAGWWTSCRASSINRTWVSARGETLSRPLPHPLPLCPTLASVILFLLSTSSLSFFLYTLHLVSPSSPSPPPKLLSCLSSPSSSSSSVLLFQSCVAFKPHVEDPISGPNVLARRRPEIISILEASFMCFSPAMFPIYLHVDTFHYYYGRPWMWIENISG